MAHLNLYLPDDVAATLKREANTANVPLSRFVLSILQTDETKGDWPAGYFEQVCGFLTEEMKEPADTFAEPIDMGAMELP